ncbi:ribbon-helix-helix protein, CopG family [Alkalibacterium sp.]|uniref:ribbon-helix-helix protein, CopG family n=1 Tax=Alkalibacterium sp. TaxID=1872447 RepID=UPI003970DA8E
MTTVRLNHEIDSKLSILTEMEKSSKSEIIKKAISDYYDQHIQGKSSYELGKELFGKYGAEENASEVYKRKVKEKLHEKHSH